MAHLWYLFALSIFNNYFGEVSKVHLQYPPPPPPITQHRSGVIDNYLCSSRGVVRSGCFEFLFVDVFLFESRRAVTSCISSVVGVLYNCEQCKHCFFAFFARSRRKPILWALMCCMPFNGTVCRAAGLVFFKQGREKRCSFERDRGYSRACFRLLCHSPLLRRLSAPASVKSACDAIQIKKRGADKGVSGSAGKPRGGT